MIRAAALASLTLALGAAVGAPGPAAGAAGVRIESLRILDAGGTPAARPLRRGTSYRYVVRYRVGGAPRVSVVRAAALRRGRRAVALIRPRPVRLDHGAHFARGRLPLRAGDPRGRYTFRYAIAVRDPGTGAVDRAARVVRVGVR